MSLALVVKHGGGDLAWIEVCVSASAKLVEDTEVRQHEKVMIVV